MSGKIFLEIESDETLLGICVSSGTVGHSLSFGESDAVIILADSAVLADSFATAVGNIVRGAADLDKAITFAKSIKGAREF